MSSIFRARLLASSLFVGVAALSSPALAQQAEDESAAEAVVDEALPENSAGAAQGQSIVVTGSRIRQDAFNSPTPIQILEAQEARKLGVSSVNDLLQRATVASGQQVDATINSNSGTSNGTEAPPTGGSGSSNIDLRGLGPERTLVLVNGRRMGSAGVRGAPAQPDIGLLPLGLVERIDVVTEGASSIYGADAVAGVVNVILREDFEGLEMSGNLERPEGLGGDVEQVSLIAGASGDRARIMAGVEYYSREAILAGQRKFSNSSRFIEETRDGKILSIERDGLYDNLVYNLFHPSGYQEFFYTPGQSNTGIPNFSDPSIFNGKLPEGALDQCLLDPTDPNSCNANFTFFDYYNQQDERRAAPLVQPLERFSFVATGSYDIAPETNTKAYFEAYYFNRFQTIRAQTEQIYPDIPALIPLVGSDGFQSVDANGDLVFVDNPLNPFDQDVNPILSLTQVGQNLEIEVQQVRFVGGITSDLPGEFFESKNWTVDASWSYDRGTGFQAQNVLDEQAFYNATQGVFMREDGSLGCTPPGRGVVFGFLTLPECTPFNAFAPSIFASGPEDDGSFSSQAEYDYLVGKRTNRTVTEQTLYSIYVQGDLFKIPTGGMARFSAGFEHRDDAINSQNSYNGVHGTIAAENPLPEGETIGRRSLNEVYAEFSLPILQGLPFADYLSIDGAARYTDESNFGDKITYRARAIYRPVRWLQLSGSYGTSYRAPNLREQFLASQGGGIGGSSDPCTNANVQRAITALGVGDPAVQNRINNCILSGIDFTDSNGDGVLDRTTFGTTGVTTIPTVFEGNTDLNPETSRSITGTLSLNPRIFGPLDLNFAVSYYDIKIKDSVNELRPAAVISRCFLDVTQPDLSSPLCDRIARNLTVGNTSRFITGVRAGFINVGKERAQGLDFTLQGRVALQDIASGLPDAKLRFGSTVTHQFNREEQTFSDEPVRKLAGTFGYAKWEGQGTIGLESGPWTLLAQGRYISGQHREVRTAWRPSTTFAGQPETRALDHFGGEYYQDISLTYDRDTYALTAGVRNAFDNDPPLIDVNLEGQRNNAVTQSGHDFFGRTFFVNGSVKF